ncbi:Protein-glutamine gamma-glutamyltransferase [compost metagenome]
MKFFSQRVLAFSFILAMFMVAVEVSSWIAFFSFFILLWKWGIEKYSWRPMPKRLPGILSVLLLGQVLLQYRTLVGQDPAYTFLLGLAALRVMDYKTERDLKFILLLGFVLVSIKALFSVDIYWIVPSGVAFAGLWYSMLPEQMVSRWKVLGKIFLISIPLTAVLFFAFPRVVMPWAMSRGSALGQIGFTDEINPGRVAEIAATTNLAFRAKLTELPVQQSMDLYWRGVVLNQSRGLSWRQGKMVVKPREKEESPTAIPYDVALEPTSQNYLFVLEGTRRVEMESPTVLPLAASVFRATRPLLKSTVYRGHWDKDYVDYDGDVEEFLEFPVLQGKVLEWVEDVKQKTKTPQERVEKLKELFSSSGFTYSLSPGTYTHNDLENFLFVRRIGFCEHFAGAYGTLARALGIPSRVIVGYQGGVYNPLGEFWKVAQKDAHAWTEIFMEGRWQRIDPTVWVAPLRLVIGAEAFFELSESDQRAFARSADWRPPAKDSWVLMKDVSFWIEDLNYRWSYFLIDFDKTTQQSLLQSLANHKAVSGGFVVLVVVLMALVFRSLYQHTSRPTPEQKLLTAIEEWGQERDLVRQKDEPPLSYFKRLQLYSPGMTAILETVFHYYDQSLYRESGDSTEAHRLLVMWKRTIKGHGAAE